MKSRTEPITADRLDLSDWVIHFIHGRNPNHAPEPFTWPVPTSGLKAPATSEEEWELAEQCEAETEGIVPTHFTQHGPRYWANDWHDLHHYPWEDDASAFTVLRKILHDGFLRTGWSFRNGKATIYGPYSAACFTEMPLYAMLDYAKKRSGSGLIDSYAIILKRDDFYRAGGRPVIYGLTHSPEISQDGDPEFGFGYRSLRFRSLPLGEQYRYVTTDLGGDKPIDWTHEREWRWTDALHQFDPPGLPLWLEDASDTFRRILILTKTEQEAEQIQNELKYLFDAEYNRFSSRLDRQALLNTRVVALESVSDALINNPTLRVEDLPMKQMRRVNVVQVDAATIKAVKKAVAKAEKAAKKAANEFMKTAPRHKQGYILGPCGYAYVRTRSPYSSVTAALLESDMARALEHGGYELNVTFGHFDQNISVNEEAGRAAARVLTQELNQRFYMWSRFD